MLQNRRATFDYEILERFEAGIVLRGSEVKSLRAGGASIAEAYARMHNGELFLEQMNIPVYQDASYNNHEPQRRRKLLLNRRELNQIARGLEREGLTVVPLKLYFSNGFAKVQIGLGRGKKRYDKRQDQAKRDAQRQIDRAMSGRNR